jgi:hypothetical protein
MLGTISQIVLFLAPHGEAYALASAIYATLRARDVDWSKEAQIR